jgi:formylglycine-generating enzyme required for sulfatase activity
MTQGGDERSLAVLAPASCRSRRIAARRWYPVAVRRWVLASALLFVGGCENLIGLGDVSLVAAPDGAMDAGDADGAVSRCPGAHGSGPMVRIEPTTQAGPYCIDAHEVTNREFNAFLDDAVSQPPLDAALVPAFCRDASRTGERPTADRSTAALDRPASGMGWCFAYAYCQWVGKHLCGRIGGGLAKDTTFATIDLANQWDYACANGKTNTTYSYGNVFDAGTCNTTMGAPEPVGSRTACHGATSPFDEIFDMSGNVAELVDDMSDWDGVDPERTVIARGLGTLVGPDETRCATWIGYGPYLRDATNVGFRCCAESP